MPYIEIGPLETMGDTQPSRRSIGDYGEDMALEYLRKQGFTIIERNFQIQGGEIDIIAKKDQIYVFLEVRYRKDEAYGHPLDTLTLGKRRTLKRTIFFYLMKHGIDPDDSRVDFIGIMPKNDGTKDHHFWHIEGVEL